MVNILSLTLARFKFLIDTLLLTVVFTTQNYLVCQGSDVEISLTYLST